MKLSDQQLLYFRTFGFLRFPGLFADETEDIVSAFEQVWAERGGGHHGAPHDGKYRSAMIPFIDRSEYLSALVDDPRLDGIAASVLGDDYNYTQSDGNYYVGDTTWHSDGYLDKKYASIKVALYLDPVKRDTGCLRVIPGSHRFGERFADKLEEHFLHGTRSDPNGSLGITGSEVPAEALESNPGDVLVFNHVIKHASFGGSDRRRMFTINYQERYEEEDLEDLRYEIGRSARFWVESAYGEAMVRTAGPERMRHLEQRMANDDHLPELARKARAKMSEPSRGGDQYEKPG